MWCYINVVCLGLGRLGHIARLVKELGERSVGNVIGEGSGMRYRDVNLDGGVEAWSEPAIAVSAFSSIEKM